METSEIPPGGREAAEPPVGVPVRGKVPKGTVHPNFAGHVYRPGQSGSEGLRAPTKSISEALRFRMRKQPKLALAIADALFKEALGNTGSERLKAISMILERLEGSPEFALKTMDGVPTKHVLLEGDVAEGLER